LEKKKITGQRIQEQSGVGENVPRVIKPRHCYFRILPENMTLWYGGAEFGIIDLLIAI
jgi:hypothetical protein